MQKVIILIALIFLLPNCSFAQNMDEQMFHSICLNLLQQDSFDAIHKKINSNIQIVYDPVTGNQFMLYGDTSDSKLMAAFNSYSKNDQLAILSDQSFPYLPLADTICIIDTNAFFSSDYSLKKDGHTFKIDRDDYGSRHYENFKKYRKVNRKFIDNQQAKHLFLQQVRMFRNQLILSFVFNNNPKGLYTCFFNFNDCAMTLGKAFYDYDQFHFRD